jgi:hypothetical protein
MNMVERMFIRFQCPNANQPNIAGLRELLSGQNSNANQPNIAGPMAAHTSSGKTVVMGKGYPSLSRR